MFHLQHEELLILVKTYPQPSAKYRETTCVAALNRNGEMRRIFPVPFRFLGGEMQFQKWEWIGAQLMKARDDNRPESYKIEVDSIQKLNEKISTDNGWQRRRKWIEPHIVENFAALEQRRLNSGQTLGVLRVKQLLKLEITPVKNTQWTNDEMDKLSLECLFDSEQIKTRPTLQKLPFDFHLHYECEAPDGSEINRHKITDWEAGALYWNCARKHGPNWEQPFRAKLETEFAAKDLLLLMGTYHRFPHQWLIVGLIYPPKLAPNPQLGLFD